MDNEQRATNLLNVFASKETEKYVIDGNKSNLELLGKYVVRLSDWNANAIYVEFFCDFCVFSDGECYDVHWDFAERFKWYGMEYVLVREEHRSWECMRIGLGQDECR